MGYCFLKVDRKGHCAGLQRQGSSRFAWTNSQYPTFPLGGREFESYSQDSHLSGHMARSFIQGLQSEGAAATTKHYATNNSEFERMSISSEVSTRALREIYLRPFELACRETDSPSWAMMSAYNRVNVGMEWNGMIMSDW
ncbi:glycosyl hydrolase family 3 N terminal domain-containing protein [Rhizoctonia solani]|nr:glycosyl hydrolase family 3 N terminal domain-containing protein [Rhizoctonia solani]